MAVADLVDRQACLPSPFILGTGRNAAHSSMMWRLNALCSSASRAWGLFQPSDPKCDQSMKCNLTSRLIGMVCAQVRDEYRTDWDAGRGGYGNIVKTELVARQDAVKQQMSMYAEGQQEGGEAMDEDAAAES